MHCLYEEVLRDAEEILFELLHSAYTSIHISGHIIAHILQAVHLPISKNLAGRTPRIFSFSSITIKFKGQFTEHSSQPLHASLSIVILAIYFLYLRRYPFDIQAVSLKKFFFFAVLDKFIGKADPFYRDVFDLFLLKKFQDRAAETAVKDAFFDHDKFLYLCG